MSNYLKEVITELGLTYDNVSVTHRGIYTSGIMVTPIYNGVLVIEPYKPNRMVYNQTARAKLISLITDRTVLQRELGDTIHSLIFECAGDPVTESNIHIDHNYTITVDTPDYQYLINTKSGQVHVDVGGTWVIKTPVDDLTHMFDEIEGYCILLNVPTVPGFSTSYF